MKNLLCTALFLLGVTTVVAQESDNESSDFFVTANISYGHRLAKIPAGISEIQKDYLNKLRSGAAFDLSAFYRVSENIALGLKYNIYKSKNTLNGVYIESAFTGQSGYGTLSDDITITFIGPALMYIDDSAYPHIFSFEAGIGYIGYKDNMQALGDYTIKGSNVGGALTISYKYAFSEHFAIGPQIGLNGTTISKFEVEGPDGFNETIKLEDENKESLSRLDLGVTAMFTF